MRRLTVVLLFAVAAVPLVSGCGGSSTSGSTGSAGVTVPDGKLGMEKTLRRGLVLEVTNSHLQDAYLAETGDPNRTSRLWLPNLGYIEGDSSTHFTYITPHTSRTMHFTWKTQTTQDIDVKTMNSTEVKGFEFTFSVTLTCSGRTCSATGKMTSAIPPAVSVTIKPSSTHYSITAGPDDGGTGVVAITVKPAS